MKVCESCIQLTGGNLPFYYYPCCRILNILELFDHSTVPNKGRIQLVGVGEENLENLKSREGVQISGGRRRG